MPQRFLRPGIRTSAGWNEASFQAQSLYIALLTLVDDWGRYDGRPALIQGECFSLRRDSKPPKTSALLDELDRVGLIQLYEDDGKSYLQISKWNERTRGSKSKFPDPPQRSAGIRRNPQEKDASLATTSSPSPSPSPVHLRHSSHGSQANTSEPDDESWLAELSQSPAYEGIDVRREHARLLIWCKENKKLASRRRFIRWLNKAEKPLRTVPKAKPLDPAKIELPTEFREWAKGKYPTKDAELKGYKTWADVPEWMRVEWKREKIEPLTRTIAA